MTFVSEKSFIKKQLKLKNLNVYEDLKNAFKSSHTYMLTINISNVILDIYQESNNKFSLYLRNTGKIKGNSLNSFELIYRIDQIKVKLDFRNIKSNFKAKHMI